jgi:hypothetical protein
MKRWAALCVGLPGTLVIAGLAVWLIASLVGLPVVAAGDSATLSEAAILADHADVVRLVSPGGADPNARARARRHARLHRAHDVAARSGDALASVWHGIIQLLIDSGAAAPA